MCVAVSSLRERENNAAWICVDDEHIYKSMSIISTSQTYTWKGLWFWHGISYHTLQVVNYHPSLTCNLVCSHLHHNLTKCAPSDICVSIYLAV